MPTYCSFFTIKVLLTLKSKISSRYNPNGRALALTLTCYAPCDRAPPEMYPLKMFQIWGRPHLKQFHRHKIPWNATNAPDGLDPYLFSSSLTFHTFLANDFRIRLVFTFLLILADITLLPMRRFSSRARMMVVPPFDHPRRNQRSRVITNMMLNSLTEFKHLYCPEQWVFHSDRARC